MTARHAATTLLAAVLTLLSIVTVLTVSAGPAAAETTIEVTTPADGRYQPGEATPLLVTLSADEALSGRLSVSFDGIAPQSQDVELAGGTAKTLVMVVQTPEWVSGGDITFSSDGAKLASTWLQLDSPGGDELVGVLDELAARRLPESAELLVELGRARFYPVDPQLLDHGHRGLGVFNQILATGNDLEDLGPDQLKAVTDWVAGDGGRLVVDEAPGTALPFDLDPLLEGQTTVGLGQGSVQFTDGRAAAGAFDRLLAPSASRSRTDMPSAWAVGPSTAQLAIDAGYRLPGIGTLLLFLLGYVVVIGPGAWLVLRRGRREPVVWLVVPALAVLATVGIYGIGVVLRDEAETAHSTLVIDDGGSRLTVSEVLVSTPGGGRSGVVLPAGWAASELAMTLNQYGFDSAGGSTGQRVADGELVNDAEIGGVAVVAAELREEAPEPAWGIESTVDGDGDLVVTITNQTDTTLERVLVAGGAGVARAGASVGPGESTEVTLRHADQPDIMGLGLGQSLMSDGQVHADEAFSPGLMSDWLARDRPLRMVGTILVVGWTRDAPSPLETTSGHPVDVGRTARVTLARVDADTFSRVEVLRGTETAVEDGANRPDVCQTVATRLIPAPALHGAGDLLLDVDGTVVSALDVWSGEAWIPVGMGDHHGEQVSFALPPGALDGDGSVYLREAVDCAAWEEVTVVPTLRPVADGDQPIDLTTVAADGEAVAPAADGSADAADGPDTTATTTRGGVITARPTPEVPTDPTTGDDDA